MKEEFKEQFACLGESTEKYIIFTVPIKKEIKRIDKNGKEISKNISYIIQFVGSARFIASLLSNLVTKLFEELHRIRCKLEHDNKKWEACGSKFRYCDCFLEYINFKDDLIECKCLSCNKSYRRKFDEKLKERFFSIYKFSNHDNNKLILLFAKCGYPYEYVDNWEKFNETSLPEKENFYSHLNIEDISDADYAHAKRICKDFEIKNLK